MSPPLLPEQCSPPVFEVAEQEVRLPPDAEVVALPVVPRGGPDPASPLLGPGADPLGPAVVADLLGLLDEGATGAPGEVTRLAVPGGSTELPRLRLVLLVGVGQAAPEELRRAGAALARAVTGWDCVATSVPATSDDDGLEAFVIGTMLGSFVFHWRSSPPEHPPARRIVLTRLEDPAARRAALARAVALGTAGWRARTLATVPSNLKTPAWLAAQAETAAAQAGLTCRVWDEQDLAEDGFGGLLAVGRGSDAPPRLVRLDYAPPAAGPGTPVVALVGKGITFDSGGLSIKPAESMSTMKRDMTGAAVVLATMAALAEVGCSVRVVGLLACAENAVSGAAMRPGDVVRHHGGRTSEVTNTDAEGRLVLADALHYAAAVVEPDVLVDVATLTGAAKVALGQRVGALFCNEDALATVLLAAAEGAGEPMWRMPLHAGYEDKLASRVADADNGASGPGAILAALFLQHFVGTRPWAHLDVAPVGDVPEGHDEWTTGPSGFGARALLSWLGGPDPLRGVAVGGAGQEAAG